MCEFNDDYEQEFSADEEERVGMQEAVERSAKAHFYAEQHPEENESWDDLSEEEKNEFREMYR